MVSVRDSIPKLADGSIDGHGWAQRLCAREPQLDLDGIVRATDTVRSLSGRGEQFLERGVEFAELVASLKMDSASVVAALLYGPVRNEAVTLDQLRPVFGADVARLLEDVLRMASTSLLEMSSAPMQTSEARDQVDNVRRMLVSMIDDARVAVLKLAERVVALRAAKQADEARRVRIAQEAHQIFAPLANRMGIWRLKWELEDLALRYLAPDVYRLLARQLRGRREEREAQVAAFAEEIEYILGQQGIVARVRGRAKHIFSIWRKMRNKNVPFDEVYDVRAVRVLVDDIAQCYAALGIIHTRWKHVPREFDDYIAMPKDNGYRSIHTAIIAPDGRTFEVQIRTHEMHQESELGVCAHWAYKDGSKEDSSYADKMNWLRQVVDWQESLPALAQPDQLRDELRSRISDQRIFVSTPKGHVVDLTQGATPLDFAYRVHTEIGHRCQHALVDGREVALNTHLETGQQVEIVTARALAPRREWLETDLGYVHTARAREKIQDWFKARSVEQNLAMSRALLAQAADRLLLPSPDHLRMGQAAQKLGHENDAELLLALAHGECSLLRTVEALYADLPAASMERQLSLLPDTAPERTDLCWIEVLGVDREGLLRDVTELLADAGLSLASNAGGLDEASGLARIRLQTRLPGLRELMIILCRLRALVGVVDARRVAR